MIKHMCCNKTIIFVSVFALFTGCVSPRGAVKIGYDFSKVKSIGIGPFTSAAYPGSGESVSAEFAKQFLQKGYNIKYSKNNVDLVLEGNVLEYIPAKKYLFTINDNSSNQIIVNQQPVELSGSNAYSLGTAFGLQNNKIVISNATIGISARLIDPLTNEVIWTNSYSYEGLDILSAVETTVEYLIKSINPR